MNKTVGFTLTDSMAGTMPRLDEREHAVVVEMLVHYRQQFHSTRKVHGVSVAPVMHAAIDRVLVAEQTKDPKAADIQCDAGCSACCRQRVDIAWPEAQLLGVRIKERGLAIDKARLTRQAARGTADWRELDHEDRACVFLDPDDCCSVYVDRPNACRKLFVVTDPELCDSDKHPGGKVSRWMSVEAEALASASLTVHRSGGMAELMLAVLG